MKINRPAGRAMFIFFLSFVFAAPVVFAAGLVPCGGPDQPDCTICHIFLLTKDALYYSLVLASAIAGFLLLASGLNLMMNGGNARSAGKSRKIIMATLAGLAIVFAGWAAVNSYFVSAGAAEWDGFSLTHDWWKVNVKCGKLLETKAECGDGVVQRENDEECDPNEKIPSCQGRTGFSEEECDKAIAGCNAYCQLELVSDDDDDDTGNDDVADDDNDDVVVDDDDDVVVMCSEENKDKVGLGCWPGEDKVLGDSLRKEITKRVNEKYDEYLKNLENSKISKEDLEREKKNIEMMKQQEIEAEITAEGDKITDPEKRKLLCQRGKYECDANNQLVCEPLAGQVLDQCCLNMGKDLPNMSFDIVRIPGAWCDDDGSAATCLYGATCDQVCQKKGQVCIGVGLSNVERNHCAKVVHDIEEDCNFSGNLASVNCHAEFRTITASCCETVGVCNESTKPCCSGDSGVAFSVGESACYCK